VRHPLALDVHPCVAVRILRHAQIDVTNNVYTEVCDAKTLQALKSARRAAWLVASLYLAAVRAGKGHLRRSQVACELVGVAGFEPAASSSRMGLAPLQPT
jgi:hypothetical protein